MKAKQGIVAAVVIVIMCCVAGLAVSAIWGTDQFWCATAGTSCP